MYQVEEVEELYLKKLSEARRPHERDLRSGSFSSLEDAKKLAAKIEAFDLAEILFLKVVKEVLRK